MVTLFSFRIIQYLLVSVIVTHPSIVSIHLPFIAPKLILGGGIEVHLYSAVLGGKGAGSLFSFILSRPSSLFGAASGREASIWQLDPASYAFVQVAEMDHSAVAPVGPTDNDPDDVGDWESSGILDVTDLFETAPGEMLLLATVQAHSVRDGIIETDELVQGGQLIFISHP